MEKLSSFLGLSFGDTQRVYVLRVCSPSFWDLHFRDTMLEMPLVAIDEESRTRPPMSPRQKNVCRGHDCSRIVGSQRLLHKNLFRKVPLFVSQSTAIHFAQYRFSFSKVQISFRFVSQRTTMISQGTISPYWVIYIKNTSWKVRAYGVYTRVVAYQKSNKCQWAKRTSEISDTKQRVCKHRTRALSMKYSKFNVATLASSAKSLLALSNPVIFTVAHVEFVKCSRQDGQSPIFVIPVEYKGG